MTRPATPAEADVITSDRLKAEELRLRYIEIIDRPDIFPTPTNWQFIIDNAMTGLGPALLRKYLTASDLPDDDREPLHDAAIEYFPRYLLAVPRQYAVQTIYSDPFTLPEITLRLIHDLQLFDAGQILRLLKAECTDFALQAIDSYSYEYTSDDLDAMLRLAEWLDGEPELGYREERRGLLGTSLKYICPRGHINDADREFCSHSSCGLDIYGHTAAQAARIATFRHRLRALQSLFSPQTPPAAT